MTRRNGTSTKLIVRNKWRKIGRELETVVVDSGRENKARSALGIHLRAVRNTTARRLVFLSRTLTFCRQLGKVNSCGFHEQVSRHVPDSE